jgi:hypothetical protein
MNYRVYVAAPWVRREEAREAAQQIANAGFEITSRWLTAHAETDDPALLAQEAQHDIDDVRLANAIVLLNLEKSEGKAVETGIALALRRFVVMIGEPSNVFHHLPQIKRVSSLDAAIRLLREDDAL